MSLCTRSQYFVSFSLINFEFFCIRTDLYKKVVRFLPKNFFKKILNKDFKKILNLFTLKDNLYSIVSTPIDINVSINPFGLKNGISVDPKFLRYY